MKELKQSDNFAIMCGDAAEVLKHLPDNSIQCCVTSPPYFGLRDYGNENQVGNEPTMQQYVDNQLTIFREVKRVLTDNGTLWLNLGDSYSGSGKGAAFYPEYASEKEKTRKGMFGASGIPKLKYELPRKNLMGIPWRVAFALQDDGWILRQDIIWDKTNAMPESVKDRCVKSHEYIFLFCKNPKYYFDSKAIAEPTILSSWGGIGGSVGAIGPMQSRRRSGNKERKERPVPGMSKGGFAGNIPYDDVFGMRSKRSVWHIATVGSRTADGMDHFARFPDDLPKNCILAGSKEGDTILDPFCGSGTTGKMAILAARKFIGIDVSPEYCEIARKRIAKYDEEKLF